MLLQELCAKPQKARCHYWVCSPTSWSANRSRTGKKRQCQGANRRSFHRTESQQVECSVTKFNHTHLVILRRLVIPSAVFLLLTIEMNFSFLSSLRDLSFLTYVDTNSCFHTFLIKNTHAN